MNPLLKKEIRLLLPAWIVAMILAAASLLVTVGDTVAIVPGLPIALQSFSLFLGATLLGTASFGQEISSGNLTILLSQPVERRRLWFVKTSALAAAFASVLLMLFGSWVLHYLRAHSRLPLSLNLWEGLGFIIAYALAFFSSGLWTTLLLRQMTGAFLVTFLAPLAIFIGTRTAFKGLVEDAQIVAVEGALAFYSVVGFFWARRLFLRAQDLQWTGGEIVFPSRKWISARTIVTNRRSHWFSALVWKEIHLHQVNFLLAGIVLLLDLASVIIRKMHPHFVDLEMQGFLELVWVLWLLMPLLIGSVTVAEEHRSGTFESQLCLPVSRRTQFAVKFCVALALSLLLGGVMPFVIEWTRDFSSIIYIVAAAIFFISFYASTVTRTTLQAIGLAIAVAVVVYLYAVVTAVSIFRMGAEWVQERTGIELLKLYIGVPILVLTLAGLMYWNFKWLHAQRKLLRRNGLAFLASLGLILAGTNGVYFRVWEVFMAIEPPHGPARLSDLNPPKIMLAGDGISVLLPDGRLWTEELNGYDRVRIASYLGTQRFIGGSNWVDAASDFYRIVGIQSDGCLWSVETYPGQSAYPLTRIGSDTNWAKVSGVSGGYGFLLLKENGSLWSWGVTNDNSLLSRHFEKYLNLPPVRVGDGTNWTDVFGRWARKTDGSVWAFGFTKTATNAIPQLTKSIIENEKVGFPPQNLIGPFGVGINTNHELWLSVPGPASNSQTYQQQEIQLGKYAQWKAAAWGADSSLIAIRSDGTLWEWKWKSTRLWNVATYFSTQPVQLGTYSGWITLRSSGNWPPTAIALAADGGLWAWKDPSEHVWLAPSRKPVHLGNIFNAQ